MHKFNGLYPCQRELNSAKRRLSLALSVGPLEGKVFFVENALRQVPGNSLPQQDLLQPERVKGTLPFSLRKACAKIGTVPDHWYVFSWDLPEERFRQSSRSIGGVTHAC